MKGGRSSSGEAVAEPRLHVVSISVEMAPIAKVFNTSTSMPHQSCGATPRHNPTQVGGLADVVTSLGRAVAEEGHRVEVILPKYDVLDYSQVKNMREETGFNWGGTHIKVFVGEARQRLFFPPSDAQYGAAPQDPVFCCSQVEGLTTIFLDPQNGFFSCGCIYGA